MSADVVRALASDGQVSHGELVQAGLSRHQVRRALRRLNAVRLARGLYRIPGLECSDEAVRSAVRRARGALSHVSAAAWWGFEVLVDPPAPQVTVGRQRSRAGTGVMRREMTAEDVTRLRGLRVTVPLRTVLDCVRSLPLVEAVVIADSALRAEAITIEELRGRGGRPGSDARGQYDEVAFGSRTPRYTDVVPASPPHRPPTWSSRAGRPRPAARRHC